MEISPKRTLTNYIRKCIKTNSPVKTQAGYEGFIPHKGEDKLFEQCYKEGDAIREQFLPEYFLSKKYCHLVRVCNNGNVYFVKPILYEQPKNTPNYKKRWRYFKGLQKDGEEICTGGIPTYAVYGLVFGCEIGGNYERNLLEENIYTAFGTKKGKLQAHHKAKSGYIEPKLDKNGIPIFNEDARKIEILRRETHDLVYKIPRNTADDGRDFDNKLENLLSEKDRDKVIITSVPADGDRTGKSGSIHITDMDSKEMKNMIQQLKKLCPDLKIFFPDE